MSSRIYITNKLPEHYDAISKSSAVWNQWAGAGYTSYMADTNKYGNPRSVLDTSASPTVRPWKVGLYAGVSRPLLPQVTRGHVKLVLAVAQTTPSQVYTKFNIYLIDSTAGLNNGVRKSTLYDYEDGPSDGSPNAKKGIEWPYVPSSFSPVPAPIILNFDTHFDSDKPLNIPADGKEYRLVVEIGAISYATSGDVGLQHRFGVRFDNYSLRDDTPSAESATYIDWNETETSQIQFDNYKYLPPNHEIELATAVPLGVTQIVNAPYRYYFRWYKYTPLADGVMSFQACSGNETTGGSSFQLYMQEAIPQVPDIPVKDYGVSGENVVFNHVVRKDRKILIKTRPISEFTYNWSLNLVTAPQTTIKKGDLFISSDDYNDNMYDPTIKGLYPCIWHSPTLGDIRILGGRFPGTKVGACLATSKWALTQPFTGEMFLFSKPPSVLLLERIQTDLTGGISTIGTDFRDFWMLGMQPNFNGGENRTVIKIRSGIRIDDMKWTLPITTGGGALNGGASMGVSRDARILYYNDYRQGGKVQRHDLDNNIPLTEFAGSPGATFYPEDIIVLIDGTICCLFREVGNASTWIYHFAADGTVLHSFKPTQGPVHHIAHSSDDLPDRIWTWMHYNYPTPTSWPTNLFIVFNVTGTQISGFGETYGYVNGRGPHPSAPAPAAAVCAQPRWGSALKGALVMMINSPGMSGIYYLNSDKTHDTYYNGVENRIPDPTIRTALLGE
jgi:hypothetical protein